MGLGGLANAVEIGSPFSVVETALAYSKNFDMYVGGDLDKRIGVTVTYTSAAPVAMAFTNGHISTGTITVVSTAALAGQYVTINGYKFCAGTTYYSCPKSDTTFFFSVGANVTDTAHNLAISISSNLGTYLAATHTLGVVDVVSNYSDGIAYAMTTSTTKMTLGGAKMGLGVAATVFENDSITKTSHGMTTALPVLFATAGSAPSPLVTGTTYFVIPVDANTIYLASTSALAQAGSRIGLSGVPAGTSTIAYTITPLAITGTPSFKWQASNDGTYWADVNTSSVTMSAYTFGGATSAWDLSWYAFRWLRLAVTGPTTGGIYLKLDTSVKQ